MHNSFCPRHRFVCCWLAGFCLGLFSASKADAACVSLMRLSMLTQVSIVWQLFRCVLPFLIAALAVMIQKPNIFPALVFLRCFSFGYFLWLAVAAFGSGTWLAVPVLWLPNLVSVVLFCWFCLMECSGFRRSFWLCIILILAAVIADERLASPLRVMLLHS